MTDRQTSKTLNYLDHWIVGPYFAFFIFVWVYARHYLNLRILYANLTEFRTVGPFTLNWEEEQYKCGLSQFLSFVLLASLQAINLFWLYLIMRIAKNYLSQSFFVDVRSDDEDEEDEEDDGEVDEAREEKRKAKGTENSNVLVNGAPVVGSSAARKEGESFADAVTDERKKDL
jgi:acyl-CoA-dependent ceramide synthase